MGRRTDAFLGRLRDFKQSFSALKEQDKQEVLKSLGEKVLKPSFLPDRLYEVSRASQWYAACLLSVLVPATLAVVVAMNQVVEEFLLNGQSLGNQAGIFGFVSSAIGIMFFIVGAWSWFVWVRTAGFGLLAGL